MFNAFVVVVAIVPFFGQGMNAAFESAVAFSDSTKTFGSNKYFFETNINFYKLTKNNSIVCVHIVIIKMQ